MLWSLSHFMCLCADLAHFRKDLAKAKHIVMITGAGVSAESGVPTFRGAGGYWRKWQAQVMQNFIFETTYIWFVFFYSPITATFKYNNLIFF